MTPHKTKFGFQSVPCIDCGKEVPCVSTRMKRCNECMDAKKIRDFHESHDKDDDLLLPRF